MPNPASAADLPSEVCSGESLAGIGQGQVLLLGNYISETVVQFELEGDKQSTIDKTTFILDNVPALAALDTAFKFLTVEQAESNAPNSQLRLSIKDSLESIAESQLIKDNMSIIEDLRINENFKYNELVEFIQSNDPAQSIHLTVQSGMSIDKDDILKSDFFETVAKIEFSPSSQTTLCLKTGEELWTWNISPDSLSKRLDFVDSINLIDYQDNIISNPKDSGVDPIILSLPLAKNRLFHSLPYQLNLTVAEIRVLKTS